LLYYDRIGLLRPFGRTGAGYRYYTPSSLRQLQRVRHFRSAGLSLKEILGVMTSGGKPEATLLEKRLQDAAAEIAGLKRQQRLLAGMLRQVASGQRPTAVDKQLWVKMLHAAGMDQEARTRWHAEFERRAPDGHQEFLLSLGIPAEEVSRIRALSRAHLRKAAANEL
jgi:DNA-binding transcriptional MerR regulator